MTDLAGSASRSSSLLGEVAGWLPGLAVGQEGRGDRREALRIGDGVDLDDLAVGDREPDHRHGPPVGDDDHPGGAVDERGTQPHARAERTTTADPGRLGG